MSDKSFFRILISPKVLVPFFAIILAAVGAWAIVKTAPKAKKRPPADIRPTVEIQNLERGPQQVWVPVMGEVVAAREIALKAEVSGRVASISPSFVPGGFFKKGQHILTISPEDYQLALEQVRSEVADAEYELKLEEGYQEVSAREWSLLKGTTRGKGGNADLALRKPHLAKAKAGLAAAKAKLREAELDVSRTRIAAPFAAMVESKGVDIGAYISTQDDLAMLVGTDEFWIEASVPVDRLGWITVPSVNQAQGSVVRITDGIGMGLVREGRVIRLLPSLETEGRMARLLISVKDPLNLEGKSGVKPLLLGSYVSLRIDGGTLGNVFSIPRSALRDNDQVWLLTEGDTLDIHTVKTVWRDSEYILVDEGVRPGDRLILSDIAAPLQGMALQTMEEAREKIERGAKGERGGQGKRGRKGEQGNG